MKFPDFAHLGDMVASISNLWAPKATEGAVETDADRSSPVETDELFVVIHEELAARYGRNLARSGSGDREVAVTDGEGRLFRDGAVGDDLSAYVRVSRDGL